LLRNLETVRKIEVRDLIVAVDGILGLAAVQNPMPMKPIDGKQLRTERRTTASPMQRTRYYHQCDESAIVAIDLIGATEIVTLTDHIAIAAKTLHITILAKEGMTETENGMMNERDSIGEEVILEGLLMSCHMVMRNLVVIDDEGLIAILKVRVVGEIQRFVAHPNVHQFDLSPRSYY
jgi:hypothetical protein